MALTGLTNLQPLHIKTVGIGTFDNAVSIGGTLTYEDVTNVDAIGIITARSGINVSGGQLDVGSNIKLGNAGVITATSFVGSGAQLTGITQTTINSNTNNYLITGTGTANTLQGEANLKFDGTNLDIDSDSGHLRIGDDQDLDLYHNGSNGYLKNSTGQQLYRSGTHTFENAAGSTEYLRITSGGVLTFPTAGIGLHNSNTNSYFFAHGSNETRLYHAANAQIKLSFRGSGDTLRGAISADANGMHILTAGSGEQKGVRCVTNGTTELYNNGIKKLDTVSTGIRVHGDEGGTAQLQLLADQGDDNADYWRFIAETDGTLNMQDYGSGNWYNNIRLTGHTGGVNLYHDNNLRLETTSTGVNIPCSSGATVRVGGTSGSVYRAGSPGAGLHFSGAAILPADGAGAVNNGATDLGHSSYRWKNIYTSDLDLSNEAKGGNDIDGTWGSYRIQEGESDLFLINNRNGKKYKFNLTEVS